MAARGDRPGQSGLSLFAASVAALWLDIAVPWWLAERRDTTPAADS